MPLTFAICQVEVAVKLYESLVLSVQLRGCLACSRLLLYTAAIFERANVTATLHETLSALHLHNTNSVHSPSSTQREVNRSFPLMQRCVS